MNSHTALQPGDEVRVIAPSMSWHKSRLSSYNRTTHFLESKGFKVSFGHNVAEVERFGTASVQARIQDLHDAYADSNVKVIIALHGGWAANALLSEINWDLVQANPKPLIGFSDITVLINALYAMTGRVQYLGPNFSGLGRRSGSEYSRDNLLAILAQTDALKLTKSRQWLRTHDGPLAKTPRWHILQSGQAKGIVIGGNIGTFYLLQGTPYQPQFKQPTILAIEDDDEAGKYSAREFDRRLESILQLPGAREHITGVLIGRFQPSSKVTLPDITYIMHRMNLQNIPIIANVDFGHTWPILTLPIGGEASISTSNNQIDLKLLKY